MGFRLVPKLMSLNDLERRIAVILRSSNSVAFGGTLVLRKSG